LLAKQSGAVCGCYHSQIDWHGQSYWLPRLISALDKVPFIEWFTEFNTMEPLFDKPIKLKISGS
jgi:hypothetical protein